MEGLQAALSLSTSCTHANRLRCWRDAVAQALEGAAADPDTLKSAPKALAEAVAAVLEMYADSRCSDALLAGVLELSRRSDVGDAFVRRVATLRRWLPEILLS
jgi:hypothetical protein